MNSRNKVNAMTLAYISRLGFKVCFINFKTEKLDGSTLEIFGIVLISFEVENSLKKTRFFEEIFMMANTNAKVIFKMPFLALNKIDLNFAE